MDINSFTPVAVTKVQEILEGALEKSRDYCKYKTINSLVAEYDTYLKSFSFFKKKSFMKWVQEPCGSGWVSGKRYMYNYFSTSSYDGFMIQESGNCRYSSTGILYFSDESMTILKKYRTQKNE